jgi:hypothetical protein
MVSAMTKRLAEPMPHLAEHFELVVRRHVGEHDDVRHGRNPAP